MRWLLLAVLASACGAAPVQFVSDQLPQWTQEPDFEQRARRTADVAARHWGGSVHDLDGFLVRLHGSTDVACDGYSAPAGWAFVGCTNHGVIDLAALPFPCVEATELAHEVGHVVLRGDSHHLDERWSSPAFWDAIAAELADGVDAACRDALGGYPWREPPT
jgi:hypothetical protein